MNIIERLIGLFTFSAALTSTMVFVSIAKGKQYKGILFGYLLVLTLLAFIFLPDTSADLFRLHNLCLHGWCQIDFSSLYLIMRSTSEPMWLFFSWSIYRMTHNLNWIQAIACFWCFGNIFYIISHTVEKQKVTRYNRALLLFSIMAVGTFFIQTISDIRSMLSFSIISFCIYREVIGRKSWIWDIPFYVFAALLHTVGPVLIGMRIVSAGLFQKNILIKILVFICSFFFLLGLHHIGSFYIQGSADRAIRYVTNAQQYSYIWEIIIGLVEQVQIYLILYQYYKHHAPQDFFYTKLARFVFGIAIISLVGLGFSYSIFRRFTIVASILILPVLGNVLSGNTKKTSKLFLQFMWILCLVIYTLSCIRGDLCSYKFFLLS